VQPRLLACACSLSLLHARSSLLTTRRRTTCRDVGGNSLCGAVPGGVAAMCGAGGVTCVGADYDLCPSPPPPAPPPPPPRPPPTPQTSGVPVVKNEASHFWDTATVIVDGAGAVQVPDTGQLGNMVLSVSGKASVRNYAFLLEGSPSLADSGPNGVVLAGLPDAVVGGIVIKVRAKYSLFPGSTSMVPGFSDRHFRHLFSFHGLAAVVHGDKLWVGNKNGASRNCAEGFLLDGANGTAAAWPLDTLALIAVTVSAKGRIQSVLADDKPLAIAPAEKETPFFVVTAACMPLAIPAGTPLLVGASGNDKYNDNFCGTVQTVAFSGTV
jgi:hypothetical protein